MSSRYGKKCKRKVNTGFCWQHYPEIRMYRGAAGMQVCIRKLLALSRLARAASRSGTECPTAQISIVQALFEIVSINKWYLLVNPDFHQNLVNNYHICKERCELARYSYLEQPILAAASPQSKWTNPVHYWAFPWSRRKPRATDSCYA